MTPQDIYEAKKLARLNELSLKYSGRPYLAPGEPKVKAPKAPSATTSKRSTLTKEQRKARKDRAVELLREGELTQREIAEEIGVTQTTVCAWAHEVGVKKRRFPKQRWSERSRQRQSERMRAIQAPSKERVQRFTELYEAGAYVADIANELGIARGTVYDWVQRYKPNKQARYKTANKQCVKKSTVTYETDVRVRRVVELYEAGVHHLQISAEVGVSTPRVYQWARRYADHTKREQTKERRVSEALTLYKQGTSAKDVATLFGVSESTIYLWAQREQAKAEQRKER